MDENLDKELLAISDEEMYIRNFQSIYYQMNAKPESMSKVYTKNIIIEYEDICELNNTVTEKFKSHYNEAGFLINVIVSLEGRKSLEFNSWSKFEQHKWIESSPIESIVIVWEFNAQLPKYQVPQKHRLVVKMSNGIKPEEMLNIILTGNLEDMDDVDNGIYPLVARVDYIDPILGEELLNLIGKWRKGLKETHETKSKLMLKLKKHKRKLAMLVNYLSVLVSILCGIFYISNHLKDLKIEKVSEISIMQLNTLIYMVFIICVLCFCINKIFEALATSIFEQLRDYSDSHIFSITKGDIKKQEAIIKDEKQTKTSIGFKFIGAIIFDLTISILTGIITQWYN